MRSKEKYLQIKWLEGVVGKMSSDMLFNRSLALIALVLGFHCIILWIAPFESLYATVPAIAILWAFVVIFFICARLVLVGRSKTPTDGSASRITLDGVLQDRRLQVFLVLFSLVGVTLHAWTKYYLIQLQPVSCISEIRFVWIGVDRSILPLHIRIGSVLGHLLTSFAYFGTMTASFNIGRSGMIGSIKRSDQILQSFFVIVGVLYAGLIGSRNAMLAFLVMSLVGAILGITYSGRPMQLRRQLQVFVVGLLLPLIIAALFSALIFSDRLFCNKPEALLKSGMPQLSAQQIVEFHMTGNYKEFGLVSRSDDDRPDWRRTLFIEKCAICATTMVYVNHGIFNLSRVLASDSRGDPVLLKFLSSWLGRLGLIGPPPAGKVEKRVYGPGGLSLAGAAYHDFGVVGLVITAALLGGLFGASIRLMRTHGKRSLIGVWMFTCLLYVLLISNMFVGFSVLPFPFIAFGVGTGLFAWLVISKRDATIQYAASLPTHTAEDGTHV